MCCRAQRPTEGDLSLEDSSNYKKRLAARRSEEFETEKVGVELHVAFRYKTLQKANHTLASSSLSLTLAHAQSLASPHFSLQGDRRITSSAARLPHPPPFPFSSKSSACVMLSYLEAIAAAAAAARVSESGIALAAAAAAVCQGVALQCSGLSHYLDAIEVSHVIEMTVLFFSMCAAMLQLSSSTWQQQHKHAHRARTAVCVSAV